MYPGYWSEKIWYENFNDMKEEKENECKCSNPGSADGAE